MNAEGKTLEQIELTPENLVEMIAIIEDGTISSKIAKKVFVHLAKNGGGAREYVEKAGLVQISDPDILIPIIHQVFADNEAAVADSSQENETLTKPHRIPHESNQRPSQSTSCS